MTSRLRSLCLLASTTLLPACPKGTEETASDSASSTGTSTPTPTTVDPTTTTLPTTTEAVTTGSSGSGTDAATDSTTDATTVDPSATDTGVCVDCIALADEITCVNTPECRWSGVVSYTYSAQGCVGNIENFCVSKNPSGVSTAMWRDHENTQQVVEFAYTPECIAEEWKPCDCDGPLACLCSSVGLDCPERYDEFCAVNINELGCSNALINGTPICSWFKVAPEGPKDDMCEVKQAKNKCLPATDVDKVDCEKIKYLDYPSCGNQEVDPVYWRDNEGTLELVQSCGPVPSGFTPCEAADTPDQPDECGLCICL